MPTAMSNVGYRGQTVQHLLVLSFTGFAPNSDIGPIQNNSGLLRKIQVRPKDLPIRSVAG